MVGLIDKCLEVVVAALVVTATIVGFSEVVARYVIGSSIYWSFEFLQIVLVNITFIGGFLATRHRAHLRVTVLVQMMPRPLRFACFLLTQAGIGLTTVVMTVWGLEYALKFSDGLTDILRVRLFYLYMIVPISGAAMTVQVAADLYSGIRSFLRGDEAESLEVDLPGFDDGGAPKRPAP